jgi:hypothetical protein
MTPKTMNEQLEEIDKLIRRLKYKKKTNPSYDEYFENWIDKVKRGKSQLQTDMKIRDEDISRLDETWKRHYLELIENKDKEHKKIVEELIKRDIEVFEFIKGELDKNPDVFTYLRIDIERRIKELEKII